MEPIAAVAPVPPSCSCGNEHPARANFYVSVVDGPRFNVLSGPYATHEAALADVAGVRAKAEELNDRACWYAYGTVAMAPEYTTPGLLNRLGYWTVERW